MLDLKGLILFSDNPKRLVDFYKKVFESEPGWSGGDFVGFMVGTGYLTIGPHDRVHGNNQNPERIIFNLETEDVEKEFSRIKDLGAKVVAEPYHPDEALRATLTTFADPDGNFFQVQTPMEMMM
ncbi:MAG: VOC family protein [bacterium]|nr:VOC family protein [bacterium]